MERDLRYFFSTSGHLRPPPSAFASLGVTPSAHPPELHFFSTDARTMDLSTDSSKSLNLAFTACRGPDVLLILQRAFQPVHFFKAKAR